MNQKFRNRFADLENHEKINSMREVFPIYGNTHAKELIPYAEKCLNIARETEQDGELMEILNINGKLSFRIGNFEEAESYYEELCKTAIRQGDEKMISQAYLNLGTVYTRIEAYQKALQAFLTALNHNDDAVDKVYNNIGIIYFNLKDYDNAIKYFQKYGTIKLHKNDVEGLARYYTNIGSAYMRKKEDKSALECFNKSLEYCDNKDFRNIQNAVYRNLAEFYQRKEDFDTAIGYSQKALKGAIKNKDQYLEANLRKQITAILLAQNKLEDSIKSGLDAIALSQKANFKDTLFDIYELLSKAYQASKDFEKALEYSQKHNQILKAKVDDFVHQLNGPDLIKKDFMIGKLEQKNRQIELQNKELLQFAYIVAHDLKTPLRVIVSFADLIKRHDSKNLTASSQEFLEHIRNASASLHYKLDDLLYYVCLDRDSKSYETIELSNLVKEVLVELKEKINKEQAEVVLEDMPKIQGNRAQIYQYFKQIIENSLKFRSTDKPLIRIFRTEEAKLHIIHIKDNGIGIEAPYQEKIFELFQQLNQEDFDGTGVGLAICRKIASLHNGFLSIHSEIGNGATFSLHLNSISNS